MHLRVRDYRSAKGWTQLELAAAAGVRPATISKAENDPETMELRTLALIADGLGIQLIDLFPAASDDGSMRALLQVFMRLPLEDRLALTRQAEALAARNSPTEA